METPSRIEPCLFEERVPAVLADLSVELQHGADLLGQGLHSDSAAELVDLVRIMNCYYSNLIEGHNTRPRDIEQALAGAELAPEVRPLALEARAHVTVQRALDRMHRDGRLPSPVRPDFLSWLHKAFYDNMPPEFRVVTWPDGRQEDIVPGRFRQAGDSEVSVGRHQPPSSGRVMAFLEHFSKRFQQVERSASGRIIAIPAAHHRLNFIHPFVDGNGRVSRLMSHAMALRAGIGGQGLWSISRGLARGLEDRGEYLTMMDHADRPRQGDRDGRGNLSEAALQSYSEWFLRVMLDQISFSARLFDLGALERRYRRLVADVTGDRRAPDLISAVLRQGQLDRGDAGLVLRTSPVTARKTLSALVGQGSLTSTGPKTPVRLAFPLDWRERLFPNLFGEVPLAQGSDAPHF